MLKQFFSISGKSMTAPHVRDEMNRALHASGVRGEYQLHSEGAFQTKIATYTGKVSDLRIYDRRTELCRRLPATTFVSTEASHADKKVPKASLFYVKEGQGRLVTNHKETYLSSGDMIFLDTTIPFSFCFQEGCVRGFDLQITQEAIKNWIPDVGAKFSSVIRHDAGWGRVVASIFDQLTPSFLEDASAYYLAVPQILSSLSIALSPAAEDMGEYKRGLLKRFLCAIRENFSISDYSVAQLADQFNLSEKTVYSVFAAAKTTFSNELCRARIRHAMLLLYDPRFDSKDVAQIGYCVGFSHPSYFSTVFKKVTGVTPATYRKIRQG